MWRDEMLKALKAHFESVYENTKEPAAKEIIRNYMTQIFAKLDKDTKMYEQIEAAIKKDNQN